MNFINDCRCQLVDFHKPTGPDGTHPELFLWVLRYFHNGGDFIPPLYLQHQGEITFDVYGMISNLKLMFLGHSRTVMGCEQLRDGSLNLLVLDPSHSPYQMGQLSDTSTAPAAMRLIRKSEAAMKAKQYQIVAVIGTIDSESQYQVNKCKLVCGLRAVDGFNFFILQQSKVLRGTRIPQDR